ncbi:MAG: ABC transporter permease [Pigmentiphaga sp.]|nr:ABC transporter permease [Pigmentiphaga sp.]
MAWAEPGAGEDRQVPARVQNESEGRRRNAGNVRAARRRVLPWRGAVVPGVILLLWFWAVDGGRVSHALLVPLTQTLAAPWHDPAGQQIWAAAGISLLRMLAGLSIGALLGVVAGVALGLSATARTVGSPTLHALRQVALFAWIPLLTAWLGNGEAAKITFIALGAFFPVFLNTEQGVRDRAVVYQELSAALLLPWRVRLRQVVLPGALPAILVGLEMALLIAWIGTVGAEYAIGTGRGIGAFLATSRDQFRMDLILLGVLVLALVGGAGFAALRGVARSAVPWLKQEEAK